MNIVITGTSRGIGLELCRLALEKGHRVLAVARKPEASKELMAYKQKWAEQLRTVAVELAENSASAHIVEALNGWDQVDVLINNAGIMRDGDKTEDFLESFRVNSVVPYQLTTALLPIMKRSKQPKVVQITSQMGSISDNQSGGYYPYRASKAAVNMINKSLAIDNPWLTSIVMHPGWVQTDMGGSGATTTRQESATGIWSVIQELRKEDSGKFYNFRGQSLAW